MMLRIRGGIAVAILLCLAPVYQAHAATPYVAITADATNATVTLTGHDLTIEQVVQVARHGAQVRLSPEARRRSGDAFGLLLEAAAEGVPVYWFNRGSGAGRENVIFEGDPLAPQNKAMLEQRQLQIFRRGASAGLGPEVAEEEIVRAMMLVRANTMSYEAASPQLTQMLLDLLNHRITPVVQSRGTVGEGDLGPLSNIGAAMVGAGEVYYQGVRTTAADALKAAGLTPLVPFAADDSALTSSNAYATGQAALLVERAQRALDWGDVAYAIDLNGMNSSVTPLSQPVQANRPFNWLNWDAERVLALLRGSYLFEEDGHRIIQDPESLRASSIRWASAWQAWAALRDDVLVQINSSDHNPAVRVGASPSDSWELDTPQLRKYYVKGGPRSGGKHGFVLSNANWDPYPLANDIEAFVIALANADVVVAQRINRFTSSFFTVIRPGDVLPSGAQGDPGFSNGLAAAALFQEIQSLENPVTPEGNALIQTVEDLQAQTRLKIARARELVADTEDLLAEDLLVGSYWLDVRIAQDPSRQFGASATAVWKSLRQSIPFKPDADDAHTRSIHELAASFLRANNPAQFITSSDHGPGAHHASHTLGAKPL
jgi:histidine ammonia-lyase